MPEITTPNVLDTDEATTDVVEAVVYPIDQRGQTDQRRARELEKMWAISPTYSAGENGSSVADELPDLDTLTQQELEKLYSSTKVRYMRREARCGLTKTQSEGGDALMVELAKTLGKMFKAEGKADAARLKAEGKAVPLPSQQIINGAAIVSGNREELIQAVTEKIESLMLTAELGLGCVDAGFAGYTIDKFTNALFSTVNSNQAEKKEALHASAK